MPSSRMIGSGILLFHRKEDGNQKEIPNDCNNSINNSNGAITVIIAIYRRFRPNLCSPWVT